MSSQTLPACLSNIVLLRDIRSLIVMMWRVVLMRCNKKVFGFLAISALLIVLLSLFGFVQAAEEQKEPLPDGCSGDEIYKRVDCVNWYLKNDIKNIDLSKLSPEVYKDPKFNQDLITKNIGQFNTQILKGEYKINTLDSVNLVGIKYSEKGTFLLPGSTKPFNPNIYEQGSEFTVYRENGVYKVDVTTKKIELNKV